MTISQLEFRIRELEGKIAGFYYHLDTFGLEYFRKYSGLYRGLVVDNKDPDQRGRILAYAPETGQSVGSYPKIWIDPMFSAAGDERGSFAPPEIGDSVRICFFCGDPSRPVGYLGGWYGKDELPSELAYSGNGYPERRGFVTRMGHTVWMSDESGKEQISINWHKSDSGDDATSHRDVTADRNKGESASMDFMPSGSVVVENKQGSQITMDATNKKITILDKDNSNTLTMGSGGFEFSDGNGNSIKLNNDNTIQLNGNFTVNGVNGNLNLSGNVSIGSGAISPVPLGDVLLQWLSTHIHTAPPGAAGGPTTPPIVPPTPALLSSTVKVKS